jgi:signal transduction histidine kinase
MKTVLDSIRNLAQYSQDRLRDKELGKSLYQAITQDIYKTDLLLKGLLTYFQVTTPIKKMNTVNGLVEEVLKKNKAQLEEKGVQLIKKLEKNLPEIIVPDEQLKYILDSVLQYVIISTPPNGSIEFSTKSFFFQGGVGGGLALFERYGGYIEISASFAGDREPVGQSGAALGRILTSQKGEVLELMLRLVKGVVLRNWGKMNFETDKKRAETIIALRFPLERRKMVFYPLAQKTTDFARGAP